MNSSIWQLTFEKLGVSNDDVQCTTGTSFVFALSCEFGRGIGIFLVAGISGCLFHFRVFLGILAVIPFLELLLLNSGTDNSLYFTLWKGSNNQNVNLKWHLL